MPSLSLGAQSDFNRHTLVLSPTAFHVPSRKTASRFFCGFSARLGVSTIPHWTQSCVVSSIAWSSRRAGPVSVWAVFLNREVARATATYERLEPARARGHQSSPASTGTAHRPSDIMDTTRLSSRAGIKLEIRCSRDPDNVLRASERFARSHPNFAHVETDLEKTLRESSVWSG